MSEWIEKELSIGELEKLLEDYEIEVDSPDGWVGVNFFIHKGFFEEFILYAEGHDPISCNADHLFETPLGWVSARELAGKGEVNFLSTNGWVKGYVIHTGDMIPIVDINVEHENHRYYTQGISSHNTGVGKSLFMCHCAANNLMNGLNVLYITLEMAEQEIAKRVDANLLNVTMGELEELPKESYIKMMSRLKGKTKGKFIVKEYPTASAGAANFRHLLNELKLKKNFIPDVIYVDYLNLCTSSRIRGGANVNSYTMIKSIAEELRGLAVEFNVPLISATQTTRSGYGNSDVEITDTSESFGLPATCDFMAALIVSEELEQLGQIMIKQLKNRYNDPSYYKRFVVGIDRARMKLYDVEKAAQDLMDDSPVMDNTPSGDKPKFDRNKFKDFK